MAEPNPSSTGPLTMTGPVPPPTTGTTTMPGSTSVATIGDPDDSSDGGGFITELDGGGPICHSCCDVWAQDCPDGEKCSAWANDGSDDWNGTRCSPIAAAPGQPGDPCTVEDGPASGLDDCDLDSMCWNIDPDTLEGTCVARCDGSEADPSCASPDDLCFISNDGVLNLCLPACDPLASTCAVGQACLPAADAFACVATTSGIDAAAGEPCEQLYDCQPGSLCVPSEEVGAPCDVGEPSCCTPYCDLGAPDPAAVCLDAAQGCTSWWGAGPAPAGLEDVGTCTAP